MAGHGRGRSRGRERADGCTAAAREPVGSRRGRHVSTPVFEGPFDVLLQLVSATRSTSTTSRCSDWSTPSSPRWPPAALRPPDPAEFLVIAAILVELKSRRLLPGPDDVDDDEELAGLRGARPPPGPPARAPGLRGRRRRLRRPHRAGPPAPCPGWPASTRASATSPRTCSPGSPPSQLAAAFMAGHGRPARVPPRPVPRHGGRRDRVRGGRRARGAPPARRAGCRFAS